MVAEEESVLQEKSQCSKEEESVLQGRKKDISKVSLRVSSLFDYMDVCGSVWMCVDVCA